MTDKELNEFMESREKKMREQQKADKEMARRAAAKTAEEVRQRRLSDYEKFDRLKAEGNMEDIPLIGFKDNFDCYEYTGFDTVYVVARSHRNGAEDYFASTNALKALQYAVDEAPSIITTDDKDDEIAVTRMTWNQKDESYSNEPLDNVWIRREGIDRFTSLEDAIHYANKCLYWGIEESKVEH